MASEMVMRVARAIWDDREAHQHERCRQTWEQGSETAKRFALNHARAAIEAMREPTTPMVTHAAIADAEAADDSRPFARTWKAMVDAALA